MASRYGLDGIVKLSLQQCSRTDDTENSEKNRSIRKSKTKRTVYNENNEMGEIYSKEASSWSCKICINTFSTVQRFFQHAKHNKKANLCWSCLKCNDAEAFQTACRALSHFSSAAATGFSELEGHRTFRCILCQLVCEGKKELLKHDCSRPTGKVGRPKQSKTIKKEPGIDDLSDYDDLDDGGDIDNDDDEDYKPELDGHHLPLPTDFLDLSNDDIDKELGNPDTGNDGSGIGHTEPKLSRYCNINRIFTLLYEYD